MPSVPINRILLADCIEGMRNLPNECADLIVADPPYNLNNGKMNGSRGARSG
jgi:modification methylase